jgi:uncharacterized heparinase superfamily protein
MKLRRSQVHNLSNQISNWLGHFKQASYSGMGIGLKGKTPLRLLGTPEDPWKGSAKAGQVILDHHFSVYEQLLLNPNSEDHKWGAKEVWSSKNINNRWLEYLHSFGWLRDLNAVEDQKAALFRAQELIAGWIEVHGRWNSFSWRPDITGRRIMNWTAYAPLVLDTDDLFFRGNIMRLLGRQTRHLMRCVPHYPEGPDKILAIAGLVQAGLFLPNDEGWLEKGVSLLKSELPKEILKDGGIASRCPAEQHRLLRDLLMLRNGFKSLDKSVPNILQDTIARMVPFMLCLTHGDGKLALFNGAYEQDEHDILSTYKMAGLNVDMIQDAPQTGFKRIECGKSLLIMDVGPPAPTQISSKSHAGTLSFEFSRGRCRMIVNCGSATYLPSPDDFSDRNGLEDKEEKTPQENLDIYWMCRSTAAHSTVIINNRNSSEIGSDGLIGRSVSVVDSTKALNEGWYNIEASHDGYKKTFHLDHIRRISMKDDGSKIKGRDSFRSSNILSEDPPHFDIRFHLHPEVKAHADEGQGFITLILGSGEKWHFSCEGAEMKISNSLYLGGTGAFQSTSQIVLTGYIDKRLSEVSWQLKLCVEK